MTPEDKEQRDRLRQGAAAALLRASKRARELAKQTQTEFVVMRDGQLVREIPKDESDTGRQSA
ncbi:MAG: hypothetical protein K2Z81_06550 [Cyanobacteria bacterium]|nr:hypothetical protein [Cyanobacteriota bacterium]